MTTTNQMLRDALTAFDLCDTFDKFAAAIAAADADQAPDDLHACANCLRPKCEHNGKLCPSPYTTWWSAWDYVHQPMPEYPEYAARPAPVAEQSTSQPVGAPNNIRPAPVGAVQAPAEGWLIEWDDTHGKRRKVCGHNTAGDYRAMGYEGVTATELVRRAAPAAPIGATPKLTECRHCGFFVALNQAPAEHAKPAPDLSIPAPKIDTSPERVDSAKVEQAKLVEGAIDNDVVRALKGKIPLIEPVYIGKALRAGREAKPCLSGGTGPLACVMLANIQVAPWVHTEDTAKAFAEGYNRGVSDLRFSVLEIMPKHAPAGQQAGAVEECTLCNGMGFLDGAGSTCPHCDGSGKERQAGAVDGAGS